jgi:hypothetical protein
MNDRGLAGRLGGPRHRPAQRVVELERRGRSSARSANGERAGAAAPPGEAAPPGAGH